MEKLFRLKITGKVQGVWYRYSTKIKARELGVKGFVKNEPDGSVYAEIEGAPEAVNALIDWCWRGSTYSIVENVKAEEGDLKGFTDFKVR